jgi:hypothetical protein
VTKRLKTPPTELCWWTIKTPISEHKQLSQCKQQPQPIPLHNNSLLATFLSYFAIIMPSFPFPADSFQRERSRSPRRRSRSPRRSRRSYSPRSRSRSRDRDDYRRSDRRSRSPMTSAPGSGGYSGSGHRGSGPPARSFEERAAAKEQMMQSLRDSSQQDRRVYVGNLAYDVKWHHLKDFMRQGQSSPSHQDLSPSQQLTDTTFFSPLQLERSSSPMSYNFPMECRRWAPTCDVAGFSGFPLVIFDGRLG